MFDLVVLIRLCAMLVKCFVGCDRFCAEKVILTLSLLLRPRRNHHLTNGFFGGCRYLLFRLTFSSCLLRNQNV
jgi:hypothetical protein